MTLSRQNFVTAAVAGAGAAALAACGRSESNATAAAPKLIKAQAINQHQYDRDHVLAVLKQDAPHKQVFQVEQLTLDGSGAAAVFVKMQNSMNAFDFSLGVGKLSTLAVLIGSATTLALNDDMWEKYRIGTVFGFKDKAGHTIKKNSFDKARTGLSFAGGPGVAGNVFHDFSGEGVRARGASMMVCHNALTAVAGQLAGVVNASDPVAVLAELKANFIPGYYVVPAGVATIQLAQDHGWHVYTVLA